MQLSDKKIEFKPTLLPTLAALAMIALTLYLSNWQTSRAAQKAALQLIYDARATLPPVNLNNAVYTPQSDANTQLLRYRKGQAVGEWLLDSQFVVDNKQQNAAPGYHVITPLRVIPAASPDNPAVAMTSANNAASARETVILVNRGWVPRTRNYPALPAIAPPLRMDAYVGLLVSPSKKYLELGAGSNATTTPSSGAPQPTIQLTVQPKPATNQVWQNLDVDRVAAATGLNLYPLVMLLNSNPPAAPNMPATSAAANVVFSPIEQIETPDAGVEKHRGYAFQWLALAIAIMLVWLVVNTKISKIKFS